MFTSERKLESKSSIRGLDGVCFSMYFKEANIITNGELFWLNIDTDQDILYTDKLLIF